ncbi:C1 family peptidase [Deinococcus sp. QL22]|uniref:C1 family peptidase n=1 Tax=Deinococcus sp. QL22 TaxID=2939437 RepID=UPI002016ADE9|nr:C1 family peptidase [Deinococcus sp. QL22]UQN07352.1 C1 family peptidase [Deinococcus sp. QL22]
MKGNKNRPVYSSLTRTLAALTVALACTASAQGNTVNTIQLNRLQLQPITIQNQQLSRLQLDPALFQKTLQAPNVFQFNLDELPARLQARDANIRSSLALTNQLANVADLRSDIARMTLKLPAGLTVPAIVNLRGGQQQEVMLYGRDTVARSVADAEAKAAVNRAEILRSFGLDEQTLSQTASPATTAVLVNPATTRVAITSGAATRISAAAQAQAAQVQIQPSSRIDLSSAQIKVATGITDLLKLQTLVQPSQPPSQPGGELGDGFTKTPTDGACRFTPTNALFGQMRGGNIGNITTIKNQGRRGTCMAFGFVSALESQIARRIKTRFNLSEQYAYYWLRGDDGVLGDGAGWGDYDDAVSRQRIIPTEVRWKYNPSFSRQTLPGGDKPITQFKNSCTNYADQACSDTTAQAQLVCQGSTNNCAWKPEWEIQENAAFNFRPTKGNEVWHSLGTLPFNSTQVTREYRRLMMKKMLDRGDQLVLGFGVDAAFDSIGAAGTPNMNLVGQNYRGGHAVHLVGYVNTGSVTINNVKIGPFINLGSMTFPTGVWIIKNSWGCGFGDGGYAYLPDSFLDQETNGVYNLPNNAVASDMSSF